MSRAFVYKVVPIVVTELEGQLMLALVVPMSSCVGEVKRGIRISKGIVEKVTSAI